MPSLPIDEWIALVFDHEVTEPRWYWDVDAPWWRGDASLEAAIVAEVFERSDELLGGFSEAQLDQGFWYISAPGCSDTMHLLRDGSVAIELRQRVLQSFVPLFANTMAMRCTPHLSHFDEAGAGPLNGSCYMWWDLLPFYPDLDGPENELLTRQGLDVLRRILAIPHDACRESALHGLGHWHHDCPAETESIIDGFLAANRGLRGELRAYAAHARVGYVQ